MVKSPMAEGSTAHRNPLLIAAQPTIPHGRFAIATRNAACLKPSADWFYFSHRKLTGLACRAPASRGHGHRRNDISRHTHNGSS
jgi:hypothetical protein